MTTPTPDIGDLPMLEVHDAITYTVDERLLVDGVEIAPGRYRLVTPEGTTSVLDVADPNTP